MASKLPAICFIDDDREEIRRFRENLGHEFIIGSGTSLSEAIDELRNQGRKRPDLFVLDLYFPEGGRNTEQELAELHSARQASLEAQARFNSVLGRLRQTSHGGLELANDVRNNYRSVGYVFFTRKGTLEDAIRAFRHGALKMVKKPDPNRAEEEGKTISEAYDTALRNNANEVAHEIREAIRASSWWWKNKRIVFGIIIGLLVGVISSLIASFIG